MAEIKKTLRAGTLLKGGEHTYEVEEVLGAGNFGITYKAKTHVTIGNVTHTVHYAIKEFFVSAACSRADDGSVVVNGAQKELYATQLAAFKREARMLCDMPKHKGIVSVNGLMDAFNTSYYVMEYLDESLAHYVETAPSHALSEEKALEIFLEIAQAAAFLHSRRRLHLDIKPDNIMFYEGQPKLIDFGQSKVFAGNDAGQAGGGGVSPGFSPLEQYSGITHFAPSADIYALGATLLYMLTGVPPVEAKDMSAEYIDSVLPPGIGAETRKVLHKCLAQEPKRRGERVTDILSILGYIIPDANGTTLIGDEGKLADDAMNRIAAMRKGAAVVTIMAIAAVAAWLLFSTPVPQQGQTVVRPVTKPDSAAGVADKKAADVKEEEGAIAQPAEPDKAVPEPVEPVRRTEPETPVSAGRPEKASAQTLGYASWSGRIKNGEPDGYGTMTFKSARLIPGTSVRANAGDVLVGTFSKGRLVNGELNGKYIEIEDI